MNHLIKPLILASRSPRRLHLLRQIGIEPTVIPCDVPEDFRQDQTPAENAMRLAADKANAVARSTSFGCVLGADTIVTLDGLMLGKPVDRADAVRMLTLLSGRVHRVHTGFALVDCPSGKTATGVEETFVHFRDLPAPEIEEYVDGGSPLDKAGAYGIQDDYGAVFVRKVEGCYYNVVGLPLSAVYTSLIGMDLVRYQGKESGQ
ncbi:MAG TPA: nucleoside triphosphate pyrophosphatase [Bacteroidota bacterium]|nr:nucleoside triphosphate pyrophosphatase [Bacteroidota bacterium]